MPQLVVTPWRDHADLLQVRREIYGLDDCAPPADRRRHAVSWITAWKLRGRLPHAVESTAHLIDAVLHHEVPLNSTFSNRAIYSAAFCRFVTGFCDINRISTAKRSMFDQADTIAMPRSFVELRHEATHDDLPSLQRLFYHTKLALDWLWSYYWMHLDVDLSASIKPSANGDGMNEMVAVQRLQQILREFLSARKAEIKNKTQISAVPSASASSCIEIIRICKDDTKSLTHLAQLLVEGRMIIPSTREIGESMDGAFTIWDRLIRGLSRMHTEFLETLVKQFLNIFSKYELGQMENDFVLEAYLVWFIHILTSSFWKNLMSRRDRRLNQEKMVRACMILGSPLALDLANDLLQTSSPSAREKWSNWTTQ